MYSDQVWAWIVTAVAAYLLGSISGAIISSSLFHKTDIRKYGSGNAGMTNALRTFGAKTAVLVTVIDGLKTCAAILLGRALLGHDMGFIVASAAVVLGHAFPVYYRFKGGKCVMCTAVILLMLDLRVFAVIVVLFIAIAFFTKIVAVGSLVGALFMGPATWLFTNNTALSIFMAALTVFIFALHHENINRIFEGREKKITIAKQK